MPLWIIALTVLVVLVAAFFARLEWRWRQARRLERDRAVWVGVFAAQGGIKRDAQKYDQAKAVAGSRKAKRQTASGRPLRGSLRRRETPRRRELSGGPALVPMASRRRAGGGS